MVSGLKINLFKSSLLGVSVPQAEILSLVEIIRCVVAFLPFSYIGIPVGGSISHVKSWDIIDFIRGYRIGKLNYFLLVVT